MCVYTCICFLYHCPTATLPEMKCVERVRVIEEHIRLIQQKWSDLKSEVAHLDRRRRRIRRKEREGMSTVCFARLGGSAVCVSA